MKLRELTKIYKVFDEYDDSYEEWFGTEEDIKEYLLEQSNEFSFDANVTWLDNVVNYGLQLDAIN